ncbi:MULTISPECIES: sensor histidine kinase [unclassified Tenacibaculum]|uniref:sensor histidine kinase n=1 Tax=unclassified Tenacibaculum TaxID=2635139 RepID=UPI001F42BA93|nr:MULTISPECIES: HAMP domain-containing sensor histidine kinase [unclassified Tenacibaculum]MCF2873645.1 HAMP domain-containing histidine kinase [Tenacibaculum sp. Cn5-1]MCF2933801.1 HAMP domain-containing histidine kinase [Tenacibaculum sp. Cn5-34]MCG7509617.1 HAMP domain-containing histidine kinase [Tenacibaculum sp. Cn5-46]
MKNPKRHWILYLIIVTILTTITVQFYWNYKNYEQNKLRVLNEIQISLDNSIEAYYVDFTKESHFAIVEPNHLTAANKREKDAAWKSIFRRSGIKKSAKKFPEKKKSSFEITAVEINGGKEDFTKMDSAFIKSFIGEKNMITSNKKDSLMFSGSISIQSKKDKETVKSYKNHNEKVQLFLGKRSVDSLKLIKGIQSIFIAIQNDTIDYRKLDSIMAQELNNKKIQTDFYFKHFKNDSLFYTNKTDNVKYPLITSAKSTFLKSHEDFNLYYNNPTYEALKRSFTGILLSFLLSLAVISSLIYLLKIINQQKELAEIKNDLISNITHEFKTPITTVSTAIEAINNFNIIDDKEKTKKYLSISSIQLKKLHQMVEKLLETATLDSEKLLLKKEPVNIIDLIEKLTKKHQLIAPEKSIHFSSNVSSLEKEIDPFHFENAVSNLIDNAIKYGGDKIEININSLLNNIEISVADNGIGIDKNQQDKIFEKFYRVPKGNTHDVKGFGIGLYYTKKIIEKHNGIISLTTNFKQTVFKISLPND